MKLNEFFSFWLRIQDSILYMASLVKPEDLQYTFDESLEPIGSELLHIANAYNGWLEEIIKDGEMHPHRIKLEELTVDLLQGRLQQAFFRMRKLLEKSNLEDRLNHYIGTDEEGPYEFTLDWILWHLLEHDVHHRSHVKLQFKKLHKQVDDKKFYESTTYGRW